MTVLQSIKATDDPTAFEVRFNTSDGRSVDVTLHVQPDGAGAVSAVPDLTTVGRWRNVNEIHTVLVPAIRAFATAVSTLTLDD